jgi:hypothetical protein
MERDKEGYYWCIQFSIPGGLNGDLHTERTFPTRGQAIASAQCLVLEDLGCEGELEVDGEKSVSLPLPSGEELAEIEAYARMEEVVG